jgi:glucuronosyltransferase
MKRSELANTGIGLIWEQLTTEKLLTAIHTILNDPNISTNVRRRSEVLKDHEQEPKQRAVFWIEYILRHNGAPHLRSSAVDLTWFQYHNLDVICVLVSAVTAFFVFVILIAYLSAKLVCIVFKRLLTSNNNKKVKMN